MPLSNCLRLHHHHPDLLPADRTANPLIPHTLPIAHNAVRAEPVAAGRLAGQFQCAQADRARGGGTGGARPERNEEGNRREGEQGLEVQGKLRELETHVVQQFY